MQRYQDSILNSNGQPVSGATVLVRPTGGTSTSAIFGDSAGTSSRANPLTSDANGRFWFYGSNSRYDLVISGSYFQTTTTTDVMLEDVPLTNLGELSTAAVARANIGAQSSTSSESVSGGHRGAVVVLASTGQVTPDMAAANNFSLAMTVNTTLATPSNPQPGQSGRIVVTQNSTAKTLAYNSAFWKFAAGATATLSTATTTGTRDVLRYYILDSTSAECEMRNTIS